MFFCNASIENNNIITRTCTILLLKCYYNQNFWSYFPLLIQYIHWVYNFIDSYQLHQYKLTEAGNELPKTGQKPSAIAVITQCRQLKLTIILQSSLLYMYETLCGQCQTLIKDRMLIAFLGGSHQVLVLNASK